MAGRQTPSHLVVGVVGRAVGLRGEVEVLVLSDDPGRFSPGSVVELDDGTPLTVRGSRRHKDRTIVVFEEIHDRKAAEGLRGREIRVPVERARPLRGDEYWDHQLIGCAVVTTGGAEVGRVTDVLHPPANDVLVVVAADGDEHLIPLVKTIVPEVDIEAGRIVVDPIPGLLEPGE